MNFTDLHELLRLELVRRIEAGLLTGTRLAQQTGFRQAHISNFLNRKRALSLDGLDRVLESQRLTVDQIFPLALDAHAPQAAAPTPALQSPTPTTPPADRGAQSQSQRAHAGSLHQVQGASTPAAAGPVDPDLPPSQSTPRRTPSGDVIYSVPLVSPSVAMDHPRIAPAAVLESLPIAASRLFDRNPRTEALRHLWQRFVAIRVDAQQAAAMAPVLSAGAAVILDRHSTSPLPPSRSAEPALFAVRSGSGLLLRFVELDDDRLILRPMTAATPVQLIPLSADQTPADHLIGRLSLLLTTL